MRRRELLATLAAPAAVAALAAVLPARRASAQTELRAWVGAEIWTGDGREISEGMLVTRGERILEVSKTGPAPAGAEIIDVRGRTLTPGWIATETALGLVEIELEAATVDARPRPNESAPPVRAAYSAADAYNPLSTLIGVARREGVTSAIPTPEGGLISGSSAWVDLVDRFPPSGLVRAGLAVHANLFEAVERSRPVALGLLRDALESARLFARSPNAYDRAETRPLPYSVADLSRLVQVIGGGVPLVVRAARGSDILRLLSLARDYQLRLIVSGADEAWTVARELAAARVPVIIDPTQNLPVAFSKLQARRDGAAILSAAGVAVIISTFDSHSVHNLRQLAGNAIASGLSRAAATRALSFEAASAFGMDQDYGLLAPGKVANFSLWNGDPFELSTWPVDVVVRGRSVAPRSRQSELFERYRDLTRVPRGRSGMTPRAR